METIKTTALTKRFGSITAADTISIQVNEGEIYGFLGLNGAGKTTLIRMLLGMVKPDGGKIFLLGKELSANFNLWNEVGYSVETPNAYPNLSVAENLQVYYRLRGLRNPKLIDEVISRFKLAKYKNTKAAVLSMGNKQRLGLAKAFMHKPRLLLLDEPGNGLDPEGIAELRNIMKELAENGVTLFLSSHILGEIAKIATRIGIIHQGKLIHELQAKDISNQLQKKVLITTNNTLPAVELLKNAGYPALMNEYGQIEIADYPAAVAHSENIAKLLVNAGIALKQLSVFTEDLEMYFLRKIQ